MHLVPGVANPFPDTEHAFQLKHWQVAVLPHFKAFPGFIQHHTGTIETTKTHNAGTQYITLTLQILEEVLRKNKGTPRRIHAQ